MILTIKELIFFIFYLIIKYIFFILYSRIYILYFQKLSYRIGYDTCTRICATHI
jgi:hypothetical protein